MVPTAVRLCVRRSRWHYGRWLRIVCRWCMPVFIFRGNVLRGRNPKRKTSRVRTSVHGTALHVSCNTAEYFGDYRVTVSLGRALFRTAHGTSARPLPVLKRRYLWVSYGTARPRSAGIYGSKIRGAISTIPFWPPDLSLYPPYTPLFFVEKRMFRPTSAKRSAPSEVRVAEDTATRRAGHGTVDREPRHDTRHARVKR